MNTLQHIDHELWLIIEQEKIREQTTINLIASENYVHPAVLEATGSILTNKYAEGYPNKRYYAGCQIVDKAELLAQQRCQQLFNAEHVNVQPHAGSQANFAVYYAALNPGDTIMGMSLSEGGHLTHGHAVNASGTFFKSIQYAVDKNTEQLDYDAIEQLAHQHKPKLIIAGASAYSRTIDFNRFSSIAKNVGAFFMADIAHIAGLVATNLHPSPVPVADFVTSTTHKTLRGPRGGLIMCKKQHASIIDRAIMPGTQGGPFMHIIAAKAVAFKLAQEPAFIEYQKQVIENAQTMVQEFKNLGYRIVADGTDTHLFVIDLRSKQLNGKIAQEVLDTIGITASRSCVPFDTQPPWITSGIRFGTPAITTRGMKKDAVIAIAHVIHEALHNIENSKKLAVLKHEVEQLAKKFPIYA